MKKKITFLAFFMLSVSALAQQKTSTVEEIYAKYITAIGGNEKIKNIANHLSVSLVSTESVMTGAVSHQSTMKQEMINFWDYANVQSTVIIKQPPSELLGTTTTTLTRYLNSNGKTTILLPDGKKQEMTSLYNEYEEIFFAEATVPAGAKLLANETFNGKQVYVVNYEKTIFGTTRNRLAYFDIESGLLVGCKDIIQTETSGIITTATSVMYLEEYKEVDGILISHKSKISTKSESTGAGVNSSYENNVIIEAVTLEFNINVEDFKNNCFQKPEECFEKFTK